MAIMIDKIQKPMPYNQAQVRLRNPHSDTKFIPKAFIKVARGMEKQYAKFMIEQMNKTVKNSQSNSNGQNYYRSLLDDQRVNTIVKSGGGLGLQKVILSQIYPEKFRNKFAYNQFENRNKKKVKYKIGIVGPQIPTRIKMKKVEKSGPTRPQGVLQ